NPAAGNWAAPQKANTALDRYGSVEEVAALVGSVRGWSGSVVHHRCESDRRRWHESLTNDGICIETTDRKKGAPTMSAYVVFTREKTLDQGELDVYAKKAMFRHWPRCFAGKRTGRRPSIAL